MSHDLPYQAEYAKSDHSKCQSCKEFINKQTLRLAVIVQSPVHDGTMARWYHFKCFFLNQRPKSTAAIACFDEIRHEDQEKIRKEIESLNGDLGYYGGGDELLGAKEFSEEDRNSLKTALPKMTQGEMPPLPKKIKMDPEDVEDAELMKKQNKELYDIKDKISDLKKNKLIALCKINHQKIPTGSDILNLVSDMLYFGALEPCPKCKGQLIFHSGTGYKCTGNITKWTSCDYVTPNPKRKKCEIRDMKNEFPIKSYKSKVRKRVFKTAPSSSSSVKDEVDGPKIQEKFEKSSSGKVKVKVKDGGVVDPDSGLENCAHIYQKGKDKYTATLSQTDIPSNKNSYYKLQILKHDKFEKYYLFRSWGRIGTTIGGKKRERMSLKDCIKQFESLFKKKTGNQWGQPFVKMSKKYSVDHGDEELASLDIKSNLQKPVQDLMRLIFDVAEMKKVMFEFEIDMDKMPLGKLSKKQIEKAYAVLTELQEILKKSNIDHTTLIDASNRFYTLIPHNFGISGPKTLKTSDEIKDKCEMLDALLEMETAYNLLRDKTDEKQNPLDSHYKQLKTNIDVLDKTSDEFKMIEKYVQNTHAATHTQYKLEIEEVFVVKRQGEEERFKPFKKLPNRKLLWHGSRTTNFAGILSQGLCIAPPEAPVTGYMFGKGIYFADMVSKSANYCYTDKKSPIGLLLLCEVALGNMYERYKADYIKKLPKGKHSTLGCGQTKPDPQDIYKLDDDIEVPYGMGKPATDNKKSDLLYNEYIVYDVAQVKVRYLVKMNFRY